MMTREGFFDLATANAIEARIKALYPGLRQDADRCCYSEEGQSKTDYRMWVKMPDPKHGNTIVRRITSDLSEIEIHALVKGMETEARKKAKEMKARVRGEQAANRT